MDKQLYWGVYGSDILIWMALSKHILFLTSATTPGMVLAITDYYCATGLFFTFFLLYDLFLCSLWLFENHMDTYFVLLAMFWSVKRTAHYHDWTMPG